MELYNFFTEIVDRDSDKYECLKIAFEELKEYCHFVHLVEWVVPDYMNTGKKVLRYSIIGQMHGEDTNVGDTDLMTTLYGIKYTWLNAYTPQDNNLNS